MVEVAAIVAGWVTPTSLFVLLNIVIATIFFTSAFRIGTATDHGGHTATKKSADDHHQHPESGGKPQLLRAPSFFSRVTSFNVSTHHYSNYYHHSDDQARPDPAFGRSPSLVSRVASFSLFRAQPPPEPAHDVSVVAQEAAAHHHDDDEESKEGSETDRARDDQSRGEKMAMTEKKNEDNEREGDQAKKKKKKKKVVAVRRTKAKTVPFRGTDDDDEVDAKADDFINKFKQQLKLQRLESLLRYRSPATVAADAT